MATIEDAARIALALPDVTAGERYGTRTWVIGKKHFAWERPFTKADLKRFGTETPPAGPILAVMVEDLDQKDAMLSADPAFFTIPHFNGYAAILIQLKKVKKKALRAAIENAWICSAPAKIRDKYQEP